MLKKHVLSIENMIINVFAVTFNLSEQKKFLSFGPQTFSRLKLDYFEIFDMDISDKYQCRNIALFKMFCSEYKQLVNAVYIIQIIYFNIYKHSCVAYIYVYFGHLPL